MGYIRNVYCVGRNYVLHAKELNNEVPTSPILFSKPTYALVEANGQNITLPGDQGSIHYETELVIHIGKTYYKGISVDELVDKMAVGIDFTLRDVQDDLRAKGLPWLLSKGFPKSAVLSRFVPFAGVEACKKLDFSMIKNGELVQNGNIQNMIFDLQTIVDFTGKYLGLGEGDVIYTGTPQGVGPIADGDQISLKLGDEILGECTMQML